MFISSNKFCLLIFFRRTIRKVSNLFAIALKTKEYSVYLLVAVTLFEKKLLNVTTPPAAIFVTLTVCYTSFICENMIKSENNIREAYYELDWYEAPIIARKTLLLAMQQPGDIKFGRIFYSDQMSLERFVAVMKRAYDFGLVLVKLVQS